jgi:hypothetical protein
MTPNPFLIIRRYWLISLALLIIGTFSGCGGAYVGPPVYYDDMRYRNPWHGHHHFPPPHHIGPPPVIMPPPVAPPVAVPLPM